MQRFAIRKVRKGRVKIGGRFFAPDIPAPQLEGLWLAFGRYYIAGQELDFVSLWGTKETYKAAITSEEAFNLCWNSDLALLTEHGYYNWEWWRAVK